MKKFYANDDLEKVQPFFCLGSTRRHENMAASRRISHHNGYGEQYLRYQWSAAERAELWANPARRRSA
jgi:hypothetical protein